MTVVKAYEIYNLKRNLSSLFHLSFSLSHGRVAPPANIDVERGVALQTMSSPTPHLPLQALSLLPRLLPPLRASLFLFFLSELENGLVFVRACVCVYA